MRCQLSLEKKIINFEANFVSRRENENWRKNEFFRKKINFGWNLKIRQKNVKKLTFFSKKNWILFSLNFTSTNRKIILKLDLKSYGFSFYAFEALNAPKYWRVYQISLPTVKYDVSAFTGKKNYRLLIKIEFYEKKWICVKNSNFEQKNSFFIKFQKSMKNGQKKFNFFKKKQNFVLLEKNF